MQMFERASAARRDGRRTSRQHRSQRSGRVRACTVKVPVQRDLGYKATGASQITAATPADTLSDSNHLAFLCS
eukprot:6182988-Pleurochrysis_carterae.AAC.4